MVQYQYPTISDIKNLWFSKLYAYISIYLPEQAIMHTSSNNK